MQQETIIALLVNALERARKHVVWCATSDPFSPEAPYDLEALDAALLAASDYEEKLDFMAGKQ